MPLVRFLNTQSWAGELFCYKPGEVVELDEAIAIAREQAGLGKLVVDKVKAKVPDAKVAEVTAATAKAELKSPEVKANEPSA